jgi:hypothetical protein
MARLTSTSEMPRLIKQPCFLSSGTVDTARSRWQQKMRSMLRSVHLHTSGQETISQYVVAHPRLQFKTLQQHIGVSTASGPCGVRHSSRVAIKSQEEPHALYCAAFRTHEVGLAVIEGKWVAKSNKLWRDLRFHDS